MALGTQLYFLGTSIPRLDGRKLTHMTDLIVRVESIIYHIMSRGFHTKHSSQHLIHGRKTHTICIYLHSFNIMVNPYHNNNAYHSHGIHGKS